VRRRRLARGARKWPASRGIQKVIMHNQIEMVDFRAVLVEQPARASRAAWLHIVQSPARHLPPGSAGSCASCYPTSCRSAQQRHRSSRDHWSPARMLRAWVIARPLKNRLNPRAREQPAVREPRPCGTHSDQHLASRLAWNLARNLARNLRSACPCALRPPYAFCKTNVGRGR
jgi:hypothetical protein